MEARIDKIVWLLACIICIATTVMLFIPITGSPYFLVGRYGMYLAFFVSLFAISLTWARSIKLKGWRNHILATIKTVVLISVFSIAYVILAAFHSGI